MASIRAWTDRQGRLWMDTGLLHKDTGQPVVELLNGQARGIVAWVEAEFGPLQEIGVTRRPRTSRSRAPDRDQGAASLRVYGLYIAGRKPLQGALRP